MSFENCADGALAKKQVAKLAASGGTPSIFHIEQLYWELLI
jgi:hypothetical protein